MSHWIDIFALSQFNTNMIKLPYGKRTSRIIIYNNLKGEGVKLTLGNRYGKKPIAITKVTLARCEEDGKLLEVPIILTFDNMSSGVIDSKDSLSTDDMECMMCEGYYAVSIYVENSLNLNSINFLRERSMLSIPGDFTEEAVYETSKRFLDKVLNKITLGYNLIPFLESFSIKTSLRQRCILALGDSITHAGIWTYELEKRLGYPVLNLGITGNQLLEDSDLPIVKGLFGESALNRLDRDIISRHGAGAIIVCIGINDIIRSESRKKNERIDYRDIIRGLALIGEKSKDVGLVPFIATITPFKHFKSIVSKDVINMRLQVNEWIRDNEVYEDYFDFDKMVRDKNDNDIIAQPYDSGDHLHPSDIGSIRMVDSIDLARLIRICEGMNRV